MQLDWHALEEKLASLDTGQGRSLDEARAYLVALPAATERAAWTAVVDAAEWFWRGEKIRPPADGVPEHWQGKGEAVERAIFRLCAVMERAAIAGLDPGALAPWLTVHAKACGAGGGVPDRIDLAVARCWQSILAGDGASAAGEAEAARAAAVKAGAAAAVVDATALSALACLASADVAGALVFARRALLMARSEGRPQQEFLSALVLARVRRYAGQPHLSARILPAVIPLLTWRWCAWAGWEMVLAQGAAGVAPQVRTSGVGATSADRLLAVLDAAAGGDPDAFTDAASLLQQAVRDLPLLRGEAQMVLAALDPSRPAPAALEDWRTGGSAQVPGALAGLGAPYVVAVVGAPGARVVPPGVALFSKLHGRAVHVGPDAEEERTLTALAALALAGPEGQPLPDFFQRVYGFRYVPRLHDGTMRVLLFRARRAVAGAAEIAAGGGQIALHLQDGIVIADPRCAEPPEARLVRYLASTGASSTDLVAASLDMPARTARALLSRMVDAGDCRIKREGRSIKYEVDDTIFTQLTPIKDLLR